MKLTNEQIQNILRMLDTRIDTINERTKNLVIDMRKIKKDLKTANHGKEEKQNE